jgi:hypothetical protein
MSTHKKATRQGGSIATFVTCLGDKQNLTTKQKTVTKLDRILAILANGRSLNRFEAERIDDHCLHSTISTLQGKHGLYFTREMEKVPNFLGEQTSVMRYWLEGDQLQLAREITGLVENAA